MESIFKQKYREEIKKFISDFLLTKENEFIDASLLTKETYKRLLEFSTSGKLVRGSLVLFIYENEKKEITQEAIATAAALELIHSSFLIHDDIMDQDHKRRGQDTIYEQYIQSGIQNNFIDAKQYGQSLGICVGDLGYFLGFELLSQYASTIVTNFCSKEFSKVTLAQMQDVYNGYTNSELSEETILHVYKFKTGRYTFSVPFVVGCLLANKSKDIKLLETIGEDLGILFQLKDDELGIFGTEEVIGKSIGGDIKENKKTIIRKKLYEKINANEEKNIKNIFGNKNASNKDIEFVLDLIKKYNIKKDIEIFWEKYQNALMEKCKSFDKFLESAIYSLIAYNKNRTK
ncbi:MAG TPA: polyprenyl synthetase family protein [Patescibacteria group bacterium]